MHQIQANQRPLEMDEKEQRLLDEKERHFLRTALINYRACLATGDGYDLRVAFRIVQLWLRWEAGGGRRCNRRSRRPSGLGGEHGRRTCVEQGRSRHTLLQVLRVPVCAGWAATRR
jgi:hypothetical protein